MHTIFIEKKEYDLLINLVHRLDDSNHPISIAPEYLVLTCIEIITIDLFNQNWNWFMISRFGTWHFDFGCQFIQDTWLNRIQIYPLGITINSFSLSFSRLCNIRNRNQKPIDPNDLLRNANFILNESEDNVTRNNIYRLVCVMTVYISCKKCDAAYTCSAIFSFDYATSHSHSFEIGVLLLSLLLLLCVQCKHRCGWVKTEQTFWNCFELICY